jgi:hypothetical protein
VFGYELDQLAGVKAPTGRRRKLVQRARQACFDPGCFVWSKAGHVFVRRPRTPGDVSSHLVRDERERAVNLLARFRYVPSLQPALVALFLFYVALLLGAAVAVGLRALIYPH